MITANTTKICVLVVCVISSIYSREISTILTNNNDATARIIGGENATVNKYPFAAALHVRTEDSTFFCGGSLYSTQWIITAGQCAYGAILFTIQLGSVHLEDDDPNRMTLATSEYFIHPDYNPLTLENDIAVIKLRAAIRFTDYIRGIDILGSHYIDSEADISAIGWGQTSDETATLAPALQFAKVVALTNDECKITYGNQIKDSMVCVEGNYNEGTCHGDTGSPLVEMYNRRFTVHAGVASFISGNGCESTDPSGYTRTSTHHDWLRSVVNVNQ